MPETRSQALNRAWVLLGAGGHARSVADVIARAGGTVLAVTGAPDGPRWSVPVIAGDDEALARAAAEDAAIALGVGGNRVRSSIWELVAAAGAQAPPVVARTATVAADATVGEGTVVLEHAHVGPASVLGNGVIVNTAAVVEHDCRLGDTVHVAPGAVVLGGATLGAGALVGSGARILPGVSVGPGAVVGAGAVVREDVPGGQTVVGVPAVPRGRP